MLTNLSSFPCQVAQSIIIMHRHTDNLFGGAVIMFCLLSCLPILPDSTHFSVPPFPVLPSPYHLPRTPILSGIHSVFHKIITARRIKFKLNENTISECC